MTTKAYYSLLQAYGAIPVAARSTVWFSRSSLAGFAGSNPAGAMDVCLLLSVVYCQVEVSATGRSLVQRCPNECGVSECDSETSTTRRTRSTRAVEARRTGLCPATGTKPRKGGTRIWHGNPLLLPPKFGTQKSFLAKRKVAIYTNKISKKKNETILPAHIITKLQLCSRYASTIELSGSTTRWSNNTVTKTRHWTQS
jgi:hypothetical protein